MDKAHLSVVRHCPQVASSVAAQGRISAAQDELTAALSQAKIHLFPEDEFQARLALAKIELASGNEIAARIQMKTLEDDARAKGFLFAARKASVVKSAY
jgi:hypothetical protein